MRKETRLAFKAYLAQVATLNGVSDATEQFTAAPSIEQKLETHIQESSAFLTQVNSYGVDQQSGEKIGLSISGTIAGRTDTSADGERSTTDPTALDDRSYTCKQTNFDTAIRYAKLDLWAKFPDFQTRVRNAIVEQMGRDRLMIGWNGTSAAATTDRTANPLLQDVNIGWMKKLQTEAAARYMTEGGTAGEIRVGAGGDYANLDALVLDMRSNLLAPWYSDDTEFVAICGSGLLDDKYFPLVAAHGSTPTEMTALEKMLSAKTLGELRAARVPFFPSRSIFITRLGGAGGSNLSIYYQNGTRRRTVIDNPKKDRVENYESVNEAYVLEDLQAACACVNIKLPDGAGGWS